MITLYRFPEGFGLDSPSPFCLKVELALQCSGLQYQVATMTDPRRAPKGKLPYIVDTGFDSHPVPGTRLPRGERPAGEDDSGDMPVADGQQVDGDELVVADSEFIFDYLQMRYGIDLEAGLTSQERGIGRAATRLAEEHLYWLLVASRWLDDAVWPVTQAVFFADLPWPMRRIVARFARRNVMSQLHQHGVGRHNAIESQALADADLAALAGLVDNSLFVAGDHFSRHDAAVYSVLVNIIKMEPAGWLTRAARSYPALRSYCCRVERHVREASGGDTRSAPDACAGKQHSVQEAAA